MTTAPLVATEVVAAGAAALDAEVPQWFTRVDTDKINLYSPYYCVLGQVFANTTHASGAYTYGLLRLGLTLVNKELAHGFLPAEEKNLTHNELVSAWVNEINSRRARAGQEVTA